MSTGDVVGPGFFKSHLSASNTLSMTFGNGEHYIYNLGVNLYWIKFLKTINLLPESTLEKALEGITKGKIVCILF